MESQTTQTLLWHSKVPQSTPRRTRGNLWNGTGVYTQQDQSDEQEQSTLLVRCGLQVDLLATAAWHNQCHSVRTSRHGTNLAHRDGSSVKTRHHRRNNYTLGSFPVEYYMRR
eukprot:NODE_1631_length_1656_cov_125.540770_g1552_i0.p3 GENE.NODE_1631_length_1656_cov_125.540770_g1552_i0~~NODE_1631_length_1656_cov_125.540770_g1552_i0.p3  ORF type:complete len:128 (+),score=15.06 NODE_1631_length_1656_cov_125.540770_g1552_i0:51-386(+)